MKIRCSAKSNSTGRIEIMEFETPSPYVILKKVYCCHGKPEDEQGSCANYQIDCWLSEMRCPLSCKRRRLKLVMTKAHPFMSNEDFIRRK